jgi:hypothetical protein
VAIDPDRVHDRTGLCSKSNCLPAFEITKAAINN